MSVEESSKNTRLGILVANRELPVLYRAKEIIEDKKIYKSDLTVRGY